MAERGDIHTLSIESLAFGGKGLARLDGMAVFVEHALPGQQVKAELTKVKKRFAEARLVEVVKETEHAAEPFCPHFGTCGGCAHQHLDYAEQLRQKTRQVADTLSRMAKVDAPVHPALASPETTRYRNKMEFAFSGRADDLRLGLRLPRSNEILDLTTCPLQPEPGDVLLETTAAFCSEVGIPAYDPRTGKGFWRHLVIRQAHNTDEIMVHLITGHEPKNNPAALALCRELKEVCPQLTSFVHSTRKSKQMVAFGEEIIAAVGSDTMVEKLTVAGRTFTYRIAANAFFQTNTPAAELLADAVVKAAQAGPDDLVHDLYCGCGTLTLPLAATAKKVIGFDVAEEAVQAGEVNTLVNEQQNANFRTLNLEHHYISSKGNPDIICCDPPRNGLSRRALSHIKKTKPRRVVYVSCDPATLARDLQKLDELYDVVEVQPVDLFPHTAHIESVATLTLRKA